VFGLKIYRRIVCHHVPFSSFYLLCRGHRRGFCWKVLLEIQLCSACSVWSVISECGEREWVGSMKESSEKEKAAEFTIWADCNGDKYIVAIQNLANDCVRGESTSCKLVCSTVSSSKFLFLSISQAQIRFSKLSTFRGGTNRSSSSVDDCDIKADAREVSVP
jgi:hypothetical protein